VSERTDSERLDWLEAQNARSEYGGKCIFRWSNTSRGWRLHETSLVDASDTVRAAIDKAMEKEAT